MTWLFSFSTASAIHEPERKLLGRARFSDILQLSSLTFSCSIEVLYSRKNLKEQLLKCKDKSINLKVAMKMSAILPSLHGIFV